MKILHTSDWHLGHALSGKSRLDEFGAFLNWLIALIRARGVEALIVAGDIFDTGAPSHGAQQLYFRFLREVADSPCRHVVVIAGNHDSPSLIEAPREVLRALDVHVIGRPRASVGEGEDASSLEDEVLSLRGADGAVELIVCAVPYLRDRDVRLSESGERFEDRAQKLVAGIGAHYARVAALAERRREEAGEVPIVALGHLFAAGGVACQDDGVRDLYVGTLAQVPATVFPDSFDYVALGHLHAPQRVGGSERIRYSGAPLCMGFGEAGQKKSVCLVEVSRGGATVEAVEVPVFQRISRLSGGWEDIARELRALKVADESLWLEVVHEGGEVIGDLRERVAAAVAGSKLEVLKIVDRRVAARVMARAFEGESLDDLSETEVFERCLQAKAAEASEEQRAALREAFGEALFMVRAAEAADESGAGGVA